MSDSAAAHLKDFFASFFLCRKKNKRQKYFLLTLMKRDEDEDGVRWRVNETVPFFLAFFLLFLIARREVVECDKKFEAREENIIKFSVIFLLFFFTLQDFQQQRAEASVFFLV